jgi:hypothetical protein
MATRIELDKVIVKAALEKQLQSSKRARAGATNNLIKQALEDEISQIAKAADTISDTK